MEGVRWADENMAEVPDHDVTILNVHYPKSYHVRFYGDARSGAVKAAWTHYDGRRTVPCRTKGCDHCRSRRPNWTCYAAICVSSKNALLNKERPQRRILSYPLAVHKSLREGYDPRFVWEIQKAAAHKTASVLVRLTDYPGKSEMPPKFDLRARLLYIWGVNDGSIVRAAPIPDDDREILPGPWSKPA
jgi:hypothetical protein